jgi:hypothetical protein
MSRKTVGRQHAETEFKQRYGSKQGPVVMAKFANKVAAPQIAALPLSEKINRVFATGNSQLPGKGGLKKRSATKR